jgi:hypothetical protein
MSYPIDLFETPSQQLQNELDRRAKMIAQNKCPYCGVSLTDPKHGCKYANDQERFREPTKAPRVGSITEVLGKSEDYGRFRQDPNPGGD